MSRTPFDQFAKQFFESFLAPLGEVKVNFEVPGEPKFIDIWFSPSNQPSVNSQDIGILSKIATLPCLIEPFRNQPKPSPPFHPPLLRGDERGVVCPNYFM